MTASIQYNLKGLSHGSKVTVEHMKMHLSALYTDKASIERMEYVVSEKCRLHNAKSPEKLLSYTSCGVLIVGSKFGNHLEVRI